MATTTITGLHIPTSGDAPNVPGDMGTLAADLDRVTVPLFLSTNARDIAYSAVPFGLCVVGASVDAGTLYRRRAGAWHVLSDDDLNSAPVANITVNTGFAANGTPRCSKVGGVVRFQDGFAATGMTAGAISNAVGVVPAGYRPQVAQYVPVAGSSAATNGTAVVNTNGNIDIRCNTTLPSYFRLESISYIGA